MRHESISYEKSFNQFLTLLKRARRVLISTHALPDGDGLGAEIALFHYLFSAGKSVKVVNPDALPRRYQFLDPRKKILRHSSDLNTWKRWDLWVIVDTNDPRRLGQLWNNLKDRSDRIVFLDHHPDLIGSSNQTEMKLPAHAFVVSDVQSSSIGELLFHLFDEAKLTSLNAKIAKGLYVSVMTDTNSFRYARTTPESHRIAAQTIELGVNPEDIYQSIYSSKEVSHLKLLGGLLERVKVSSGGKLAWIELDLATRKRHRAAEDDTLSFLNLLLLLRDADVVCLFREEGPQVTRVSIKSKGRVIVNQLACHLGGGGHVYAAGATLNLPLDLAVKKVTRALAIEIKKFLVSHS